MSIDLKGRDFLKEVDLTPAEFLHVVDLAATLKAARRSGREEPKLAGKNVALLFEKPSTRTRAAFEVAAGEQGARTTYLDSASSHITHREAIQDTARVLDRLFHAILYRGYEQQRIETLAQNSNVPVWNGMTNDWHPTQMLGDILTIREHSNKPLVNLSVAYIGNGYNNIANSLLAACALCGVDIRVVSPCELAPARAVVSQADSIALQTGARVTITSDTRTGLLGVDYVYTDAWFSMHERPEQWRSRLDLLRSYRVTTSLLDQTDRHDTKFMHCLPAYYNLGSKVALSLPQEFGDQHLEVTQEVFESERCIVFDQAENRMHTIKALMVATLS